MPNTLERFFVQLVYLTPQNETSVIEKIEKNPELLVERSKEKFCVDCFYYYTEEQLYFRNGAPPCPGCNAPSYRTIRHESLAEDVIFMELGDKSITRRKFNVLLRVIETMKQFGATFRSPYGIRKLRKYVNQKRHWENEEQREQLNNLLSDLMESKSKPIYDDQYNRKSSTYSSVRKLVSYDTDVKAESDDAKLINENNRLRKELESVKTERDARGKTLQTIIDERDNIMTKYERSKKIGVVDERQKRKKGPLPLASAPDKKRSRSESVTSMEGSSMDHNRNRGRWTAFKVYEESVKQDFPNTKFDEKDIITQFGNVCAKPGGYSKWEKRANERNEKAGYQ